MPERMPERIERDVLVVTEAEPLHRQPAQPSSPESLRQENPFTTTEKISIPLGAFGVGYVVQEVITTENVYAGLAAAFVTGAGYFVKKYKTPNTRNEASFRQTNQAHPSRQQG